MVRGAIRAIACSICRKLDGAVENLTVLQPYGTINLSEASSILLDKLEEMGCDANIYLPDAECKVYEKAKVRNFLLAKDTNQIRYVAEKMDCDDLAAILFGKFAGLIWTNLHALNWFIDEVNQLWFIEPQDNRIAKDLEDWQGWQIRFFIGR